MNETPTTNPVQGFYLEASFDRLVRKEKKDKEGKINVSYEVVVIVRTEEATNIYSLKTWNPEHYKGMKAGHPLRVCLIPRAFRDFLYFTIVD